MKNGKSLLVAMVVCGTALFGCASQEVEQVEEPKQEQQQVEIQKPTKVTYNDMIKAIQWEMVQDEFGDTTVTGKLTNTSDKEIEYIEIEYKFIKDGVTVDSSFTNAVNIEPNETVLIEILTFEEFDTMQVKDAEVNEWITVEAVVTEQPTEEEVVVEEEPVEEVEETQEDIWEVITDYADLETEHIKLVSATDNEVKLQYSGTIIDYVYQASKEANNETNDNFELVNNMLSIAFGSMAEPEKTFTLIDKDGAVIYSYSNGEPLVNNMESLQ